MFVPSQNLHAEALAPDGMAFGGGISESNSIWLRIGGQGPLDRISALISRKRDQSPPNPPPPHPTLFPHLWRIQQLSSHLQSRK